MNSYIISLLLFIQHVVRGSDQDQSKYYKVSMVASETIPSEPAVFQHAESPVWDVATSSLMFVDVAMQNVHKLDYHSGKIATKHIEYGQAHVVTTVAKSKRLLVAVRTSLFLMDWNADGDSGLRPLTSVDLGEPDNLITEGKADSKGRFWMGTAGKLTETGVMPDRGSLYSVSQHALATPRMHIRPVTIINGLVWALNHSLLYFTDSATQKIEAFDFDADRGTLGGRRVIIDVTSYGYDETMPDGITIDNKGNLWVALMFGGTVLHINPDERRVIYGYKFPVSRTSSVAWGGPKLDELFVTTLRRGANLDLEPLAGAIFTIRETGSAGLPHHPFVIDNPDSY